MKLKRKWEILFEDGPGSFLPDNVGVLEVSETAESVVPNAPIEDGSFSAYNKVLAPRRLSIKLGSQGMESERAVFDWNLKYAQEALTTFRICSDTSAWSSMTIESVSRTTSATDGIYLNIYDVEFVEIIKVRLVEGGAETVKDQANAKVKNGGNKQATELTEKQRETLENQWSR